MLSQIIGLVVDIGLGALAYRQAILNRTHLKALELRVLGLEKERK